MKKLLILLVSAMLVMTANAQFPFPMSGNFLNLSVDTKASFGIAYSATTAKVHIKGAGTTTGTKALYIENNASSMMFQMLDDGNTILRTAADKRYTFNSGQLSFLTDGGVVRDQIIQGNIITWDYCRFNTTNSLLVPSSSGSNYVWRITTTGSDASFTGANNLTVMNLMPTWNLSGGSTVDCIGIDYNPTVTLINSPGIHYGILIRAGRSGFGTATPKSTVEVSGSHAGSITTVTTTATLGETNYTVLCNTAGGGFTVNLPEVSTCPNRIYYIVKIDATGTLTIDPNGAQLINGAATITKTNIYSGCAIQNDGSAWYTISTW